MLFMFTERYNIWYRHSGQPEPDEIPGDHRWQTMSEIQRDVGDNTITHMSTQWSDMPDNLSTVAPHLIYLSLYRIHNITDERISSG